MKIKTNIYILEKFNCFKTSQLSKLALKMPTERIEKFKRLTTLEDRLNCTISYFLLWYILENIFKLNGPPKLGYKKSKKPFLNKYKNLFFNISHSKNAIVCGISKHNIGVDIELIRNLDIKTIKKACTNSEFLKYSKYTANKAELFFKIWTRKESFCKKNGISIFSNFSKLDAFSISNTYSFAHKNYIISVSSSCHTNVKIKEIYFYSFFKFLNKFL